MKATIERPAKQFYPCLIRVEEALWVSPLPKVEEQAKEINEQAKRLVASLNATNITSIL